MEREKLFSQTKLLLKYLEKMETIFQDVKEKGESRDFYGEVKPFAEKISEILTEWSNEGEKWLAIEKPKKYHRKQIESVCDQMELLSVQAFFPETSKKRFFDYVRTVRYNLLSLIDHLDTKKRTSK